MRTHNEFGRHPTSTALVPLHDELRVEKIAHPLKHVDPVVLSPNGVVRTLILDVVDRCLRAPKSLLEIPTVINIHVQDHFATKKRTETGISLTCFFRGGA